MAGRINPRSVTKTVPSTYARAFGDSDAFIRLLPSRVGFAERDASRPAFGGRSLVSLTKHTCVGRGPIGPRLSVRVSRPKKSATTPALWVRDLTVKERLSGASWRGEATAWRSHGLSAAKDGD